MNHAVIALHLLPHIPAVARAQWLGRALIGVEATRVDATLTAMRRAHPDAAGELLGVEALLRAATRGESAAAAEIELAAGEIAALHASRLEPWRRPFAGRGCEYCRAPCAYGQLFEIAIAEFETRVWDLAAASGARPDAMADLARLLLEATLPAGALVRFDARMTADLAYCLTTSLAGVAVALGDLPALEGFQRRLVEIQGISDA